LKEDIKYPPNKLYLSHFMLIFLCPLWFCVKLLYLSFHVLHVLQKEHYLYILICFQGQIWTQHLSFKKEGTN
jgi:hypothetical protein